VLPLPFENINNNAAAARIKQAAKEQTSITLFLKFFIITLLSRLIAQEIKCHFRLALFGQLLYTYQMQ
jgi:hypothetical protein